MDAHSLLSLVGQKTETRFNCFLTENRKSTEMVGTPSTVRKLLPPLRRSPSLEEGGLGFRRSRPPALPSIAYRGFAVAPITLRAPSRRVVVITSGTNGRAMRAPTGYGDAAQRCKRISPLRFLPRCRGAHRAPADILQTFDFSSPKTSLFEGGGPPAGGGRSKQAVEGV